MTAGAKIAARVAKGLARAGARTGAGEYFATLRQIANVGSEWAPVQTTTDTTLTIVDLNKRVHDNPGTLIGQTLRTLLVSASAGVTIAKADKVAVGLTAALVATAEAAFEPVAWHEIAEVRPLAPGGTVLLWEVDLAR